MTDIQIPGLEIIEKLGEGGMASVWKARQLSLDRVVAVKILSAAACGDESDVQRLYTEAKSSAKLKHPGIVQVYDVNLERDIHYIVMEYIDGYTVRDWLGRKGRLSESEALQVADCVADALGYAWDKERIIHCDIKPDNIMVDSDGTVKVADLGLARSARAAAGGVDDSNILGTPAYMSPEQVMGVSDLDCRSDVYSLGAMLYELLTGQYPFYGHTEEQILEMQVRATIQDPTEIVPKLSRGTFWLLEKMLAKDRTKRHQNWEEVRSDIAKVLKGKIFSPLLVGANSTVRRSRHAAAPHRAPVVTTAPRKGEWSALPLVAGVVGVLVLAAAVIIVMRIVRTEPPMVQAPAAREPSDSPEDVAAGRLFEDAAIWGRNNPTKYTQAIASFKEVAEKTAGTRYARRAESEVTRLSVLRESAITAVLDGLRDETTPMINDRKYGEAAGLYESYNGEFAAETVDIRRSIAEQFRDDQRRVEASAKEPGPEAGADESAENQPVPPPVAQQQTAVAQAFDNLLDNVATKLLTEGLESAQAELAHGMASDELSARRAELQPLKDLLDGAGAVNVRILESFRAQKGRQINVNLSRGAVDFVVVDVKEGQVFGIHKKKSGAGVSDAPLSFGVGELSPTERVQRMGPGDSPAIALAKGLLAHKSRAFALARTYFSRTHGLISARLVARLPGG